jgi:hypothetical protein
VDQWSTLGVVAVRDFLSILTGFKERSMKVSSTLKRAWPARYQFNLLLLEDGYAAKRDLLGSMFP